ncbi:hypothetical protein [Virgibacillus sp. Bac330]|uniref:hypothetical protein n=1 Tax=Virgibacillus sp. Bac330 TaxID=2419841 RepID=UPI000EF4581C|nr:hypothetical protein [Virgibacillus sp. Bac330]
MLGEEFTLLAPIFYLILFFTLVNFLYLSFFRNKIKSNYHVVLNSLFFLVIATVLLFQEGIIVDEFNKSPGSMNFILSIISGVVFLLSLFFINKKTSK